jgi:hypothetical protein
MKFRKSKNQSETSEVESYPVYENLGEIIDVTLCPKVNGSYTKTYSYLCHSTSAAEEIFSVSSIENFNFLTSHSVNFRSRQHFVYEPFTFGHKVTSIISPKFS